MLFNFRSCLMSALAFSAILPASAQEAPPPPEEQQQANTSEMLTNWLMIDVLDRNCRIFGLTDRVALTREIGAYTRVWRASQGAATPDALLANLTGLTETAVERAEEINCDDAMNYLFQARREYFRSLLAQIVSAAGNESWDSEPDAIKASWQALVNEIGGFFGGEEFNRLRGIFQAEVEGADLDREELWSQLRPILFATHWQLSVAEDGFSVYPQRQAGGQFNYVFTRNETEEDLPYSITAPTEIAVSGEDGQPHALLSATGKSDDDRVVVFLQKYDSSAQPNELNASMLVQQPAQAGMAPSLRSFDAEPLPEEDCPTDFCFIFPADATPATANAQNRAIQLVFTPVTEEAE